MYYSFMMWSVRACVCVCVLVGWCENLLHTDVVYIAFPLELFQRLFVKRFCK